MFCSYLAGWLTGSWGNVICYRTIIIIISCNIVVNLNALTVVGSNEKAVLWLFIIDNSDVQTYR
jgi:hypothetical protein